MPRICYLCSNKADKSNRIGLHKFPNKSPHIRQEWLKICKLSEIEDVSKLRICSEHFRLEDFKRTNTKIRLSHLAIPSTPDLNSRMDCYQNKPLNGSHASKIFTSKSRKDNGKPNCGKTTDRTLQNIVKDEVPSRTEKCYSDFMEMNTSDVAIPTVIVKSKQSTALHNGSDQELFSTPEKYQVTQPLHISGFCTPIQKMNDIFIPITSYSQSLKTEEHVASNTSLSNGNDSLWSQRVDNNLFKIENVFSLFDETHKTVSIEQETVDIKPKLVETSVTKNQHQVLRKLLEKSKFSFTDTKSEHQPFLDEVIDVKDEPLQLDSREDISDPSDFSQDKDPLIAIGSNSRQEDLQNIIKNLEETCDDLHYVDVPEFIQIKNLTSNDFQKLRQVQQPPKAKPKTQIILVPLANSEIQVAHGTNSHHLILNHSNNLNLSRPLLYTSSVPNFTVHYTGSAQQ